MELLKKNSLAIICGTILIVTFLIVSSKNEAEIKALADLTRAENAEEIARLKTVEVLIGKGVHPFAARCTVFGFSQRDRERCKLAGDKKTK